MSDTYFNTSRLLKDNSIRVGFTEDEPYAFSCVIDNSLKCTNFGTELEFIYTVLVGMFHLNVSWSYYNDYNEVYKALDAYEIDLIGNTRILGITSSNNETVYQTSPSEYLTLGFFEKSSIAQETLNPLNNLTWDLLISVLGVSLILIILRKVVGEKLKFTFISTQFFYFFWFILMTLLMELYGNMLTNDLFIKEKATTSFKSLNDLGQKLVSNTCHFAIFDKYNNLPEFDYVFKPEHNLSWTSNFKQAYKTNPPMLAQSRKEFFLAIMNGACVIGLDIINIDTSIYDDLCDIDVKIFPDEIPIQQYGYYHKIGSLKSEMDVIIASDAFIGFTKSLFKKYLNGFIQGLKADCKTFNQGSEISLQQLLYCFLFLFSGLLFSCIFCILQKLKWDQSVKENVTGIHLGEIESSIN